MKPRTLMSALIAFAITSTALAQGLPFNPGLWETTVTRTNPMTGQPTTDTRQECVESNEFDPRSLMQGVEECEMTDQTVSGDTLTFTMTCNQDGGTAAIEGQFQTDGQTGAGQMSMSFSFGGQTMNFESNSTSKRLGDC